MGQPLALLALLATLRPDGRRAAALNMPCGNNGRSSSNIFYVSLASNGLTETALSVRFPGLNTPASFNANFSHTNFNVVRVGLNYQFH
jgi:hypothetical protein